MISLSEYLNELKAQINIATPSIIGLIFYKIPWLVSIHFVGKLGAMDLAAAALATTLCNVTGMSFSVGLNSAITTLTGQSRGDLILQGEMMEKRKQKIKEIQDEEKKGENSLLLVEQHVTTDNSVHIHHQTDEAHLMKYNSINIKLDEFDEEEEEEEDPNLHPLQPLVYFYRALAIQLAFVIPVGIWWLSGIKPLLLYLGQGEELSTMAEVYLKILTPGLWAYSLNWTLVSWLQCLELASIPAVSSFIGFSLHIPFNILFVNILNFGYIGVAMATVMFQIIQPFLTCLYVFGTSHGRQLILEKCGGAQVGRTHITFVNEMYAAISSWSGIQQYLSLALPGMVAISEWWASEVTIFLAGRLVPYPDYSLDGMTIYQTINTFCFMFPIGFSTAASARVGMYLGKNDSKGASVASTTSIFGASCMSITLSLILFLIPYRIIPSFFSADENVIQETSYTLPFLALYVIADGLQTCFNGIFKGCGRQAIVMPIVIVSYWIFGVPLAYYFAFTKNHGNMLCEDAVLCGTVGLVAGMTIGTWIHFILMAAAYMYLIDWKQEGANAQNRLSMEKDRRRRRIR